MIDGVSVTPVDSTKANAVILFGDVTHVLGPFGTYASQVLHAKTAALIYPDIAGITDGAAAIAASLKAAGVKVKSVAYDPNETDLIGPLTSAGASSADLVIPYTEAGGCVDLAKGLMQLGITDAKKIVSAPLCLNSQVAPGPRRRLPDLDLRDRELAVRRSDRPGDAAVREGDAAVRTDRRGSGPVEHRRRSGRC